MKSKRYLKQWVSIVLTFVLLCAVPLYAAEQKPVLKLEDAIKAAIIYSNQMVLNSKEQTTLKEQLKANQSAIYFVYQQTYLKKAKNEQQKQVVEDQIASDITDKYNAMLVLQREMDNLTKNIDIKAKELKQMQLKSKKGLINPITYQAKEVELEGLKTTKQAKIEELKNDQDYFKIITGKDLTQYSLDDTGSYEIFKIQGSVDGYLNSKISDYLKYDKALAELIGDNVILPGSAPPFYADYLENQYNADKGIITVEETQKNLKQTLINNYSTLLSIEQQIITVKSQLQLSNKKLKTVQLRYKAGLVSSLDYDKEVLAKQELELNLTNLINQYNVLKDSIQKPWVISTTS